MIKNIHSNLSKYDRLEEWFSIHQASMVAFSGGTDSSLVLYLARRFQGKENVLAVISASESLKQNDLRIARDFCSHYDIQLIELKTKELSDPHYYHNPENRCYYCKTHLFEQMQNLQKQYPGYEILSGTNKDDLGDYRPGLQAGQLYHVLTPLADCDINKSELRAMARHFALPNWDKPASPCLSSRIPYHEFISAQKLKQIELAETLFIQLGFKDVRVRHYGQRASIEVPQMQISKLETIINKMIPELNRIGFTAIEIDKEGLVSGKLNREILHKA